MDVWFGQLVLVVSLLCAPCITFLLPLARSLAPVQMMFHLSKPFLFASRKHLKAYDLLKQALAKKPIGGCKFMSSFDMHPGVCCARERAGVSERRGKVEKGKVSRKRKRR